MRRACFENIFRAHRAGWIKINIRRFVYLCETPVNNAPPFNEIGKRRLKRHAPACLAARIGEDGVIAALTEGARGFKPRRAGADDENFIF